MDDVLGKKSGNGRSMAGQSAQTKRPVCVCGGGGGGGGEDGRVGVGLYMYAQCTADVGSPMQWPVHSTS